MLWNGRGPSASSSSSHAQAAAFLAQPSTLECPLQNTQKPPLLWDSSGGFLFHLTPQRNSPGPCFPQTFMFPAGWLQASVLRPHLHLFLTG